ncbi:MAG: Asp-tRNA(Asn)/Glu-tRNA(Gln) amidotransferase subunit GatC [Calditrichaceae bacterium]|nr:Asp-tRNA(Asn)/Glu-tRNA(Gln) amidotransferase subunit GatC [Calditrichaceae bacterium]MBN2710093.1 Asp-tRNA(Asn)/Glu-tRNA(Gln) amidotransferase subunit GatC [Calditrichaceae bacterium]RQV94262.1 MAG: Asp-tRNA(Asn)/Glu-tRNA(Gln) amidotransferase subunit GatC [Calditrichota bacterium]
MAVTESDVENIAHLARLKITEEEKEKFVSQVNQILEYVEKLNEINTDEVEPLSHTLNLKNVFREDIVKDSLPQKEALKNAPAKTDKFFRVPKVVTK